MRVQVCTVLSVRMALASRAAYSVWSASCRALIPKAAKPSAAEHKLYSTMIRSKSKCVYCGDAATSMDHFRALMGKRGTPSGYCDDIWNRVPCCVTCNSSKGNKPWREFMMRTTGKAPLARGVSKTTHYRRMLRLAAFERAGSKFVQRWKVSSVRTDLKSLRLSVASVLQKHAEKVWKLKMNMV